MDIIVWIILGALAGWIASVTVEGGSRHSILSNVIVGIIGATTGGYIMSMLGYGADGFDMNSMVVAVMGAIVSLLIYKNVASKA